MAGWDSPIQDPKYGKSNALPSMLTFCVPTGKTSPEALSAVCTICERIGIGYRSKLFQWSSSCASEEQVVHERGDRSVPEIEEEGRGGASRGCFQPGRRHSGIMHTVHCVICIYRVCHRYDFPYPETIHSLPGPIHVRRCRERVREIEFHGDEDGCLGEAHQGQWLVRAAITVMIFRKGFDSKQMIRLLPGPHISLHLNLALIAYLDMLNDPFNPKIGSDSQISRFIVLF